MNPQLKLVLCILLPFSLLACGKVPTLERSSPAPQILEALGGLPQDTYVDPRMIAGRRTAALGELGLLGSQVDAVSSNAVRDDGDHSCMLGPANGELSWCRYKFEGLLQQDAPLVLKLSPKGESPGKCYVANSDYASNTWHWTEVKVPVSENNIALPGSQTISPAGNLYVVVATFDQSEAGFTVGKLSLSLDTQLPPPVGFEAAPGDGSQTPVTLSWVDPAVSFDPDGPGGNGQFAYDSVRINRSDSPLGPWQEIATLPAGTTSYPDLSTLGASDSVNYYLADIISGQSFSLSSLIAPGLIDAAVNQLVARFTISPKDVSAGGSVTFDATSSTYSGGTLSTVQWDFNGDGVWDKDTAPARVTTRSFSAIGRYNPRLRLTLNLGGGVTKSDTVSGFLAVGDQRGDWSEAGRNGSHTGRSPIRSSKNGDLRGSYAGSGGAFGSPVVNSSGEVYVPTSDGKLYYLNADLTAATPIVLGNPCVSTPAMDRYRSLWVVLDEPIFLKRLACVWSDHSVHTYPPNLVHGNPVISADGLFVVVSSGNYVYKALTGATSPWYAYSYRCPGDGEPGTPAVAPDGSVYVPVDDQFHKLNANLGFIWKTPSLGSAVRDISVAADGTVLATYSSWVVAYTPTGTLKWGNELASEWAIGAPAIDADGNLFVSTGGGHVHAYAKGGWDLFPAYYDPTASFVSPPVIDGAGNLYLLTADGRVISLTRKLYLRWSKSLGSAGYPSTMAIGNDGTLYVGGANKVTGFK